MTDETYMKITVYWNPVRLSMTAFVLQWAVGPTKPKLLTYLAIYRKICQTLI